MEFEFWALEKIKLWHSRGDTFDECKRKLIHKARSKYNYFLTEEDAIRLVSSVRKYSEDVVKERRKHLAMKPPAAEDEERDYEPEVVVYPNIKLEESRPRWKKYIENIREKNWPEDVLDMLDEECSAVADAILVSDRRNHPSGKRTKGLVLGHVQSGKTANMAGVMALLADSGYKAVFVLSGIHNSLNEQTTRRFENDLWTYELWDDKEPSLSESVKKRNSSWSLLTRDTDHLTKNTPLMSTLREPVFAVFKKNTLVMERLLAWLQQHGSFLQNSKILIIDDECDQASPNIADITEENERESEASATNRLLWQIMSEIPKASYVGYTATPYATVLNEPPGDRSLYPSDFIYTLPKPEHYLGATDFYGKHDTDDFGLDIVRTVPEILKDEVVDKGSLKLAMLYFITAGAARRYLRNHTGDMTMLVHTSQFINRQQEVAEVIHEILADIRKNFIEYLPVMESVWDEERNRLLERFPRFEPFDQFRDYIWPFINGDEEFHRAPAHNKVVVRIDNSRQDNENRLNYTENPLAVIAVGGNTFSRGLTLEGLMVSYFTRSVGQYDTLMQMGRWFGFRPGYTDLVRVWTTDSNADFFRFLSLVEQDIRDQVNSLYDESGRTPNEVAISVLSHPGMRVVRKNAMQSAIVKKTSFFSSAPQTIYFDRRAEWLKPNWEAGNRLLHDVRENVKKMNSREVYSADYSIVCQFLNNYKIHDNHRSTFNASHIAEFIANAAHEGYTTKWNVVIASPRTAQELSLSSFKKLNRSKMRERIPTDPNCVNIKSLRSPGDLFSDIDQSGLSEEEKALISVNSPVQRSKFFQACGVNQSDIPGLLLLYPIDKDSEPERGNKQSRAALNAEHHMLGLSIVFPYLDPSAELIERVGIPLNQDI